MLEVVKAEIPDVREINHDVDPEIARILDKMIAKDPVERYQNCHELITDLSAHPLVAKGGPISLQPKMSTAAATIIGQKTPVSAQSALPSTPRTPIGVAPAANTRITPSGLPAPPVAGAAAHQSVLDRTGQSASQRNSARPWAIAAILVLGSAGAAYAYRDTIPGLAGVFGTHATTPANPPTVPNTATANTTPPAVPAPGPNNVAMQTPDPASASTAEPPAVQPPAPPPPPNVAADGTDAPAARASEAGVEALRELPAAQAAENAPAPRIAKASVPDKPVVPPKPRVPTIAVVAAGDDVISSPAEEALVSLLQSRGFRVIEGGRTHGDRPNLGALSGRADAVVFVNARPVGTQQLNYYGQSSTLYTVQLGIKAYKVADGSVLWTSGSEQVNFTSLNAAEKAREAIEPMLDNVDSRLDEFRARKRG